MKMNLPLMKLTIQLLLILIFFTMIFMISAILYSSRYWSDVYNYINANITIKRISTLSELNLTVIEVEWTTEFYTTIEEDTSTEEGFDFDIDEFTNIQGDMTKTKRNAKIEKMSDYNELPTRSVVVDYFYTEESDNGVWKKFVKDLVDESKLVPKNLDEIEMVNKKNGKRLQKLTNICHGNTSDVSNIFPWIATIFIKNNTANNQYQYICDGALLGDKLLITAARCFIFNNSTVTTDNVLVFLGKRSLQTVGEDERTVLVSQIKIHPNFTNEDDVTSNDLALLVLEEPVMFSDSIRPACLGGDGFVGKTATTAWDITGALKPLLFLNNKKEDCNKPNDGNGTFCDTYGNTVALCPSHGGLHASKRASRWYLDGIRSGDPQDRGLCYDKTVKYTSLTDHLDWIMDNME